MNKQFKKRMIKEVSKYWRLAWNETGFHKYTALLRYGWSKNDCCYESPDTLGDYRTFFLSKDYNPNTRNDRFAFGFEYDDNSDTFYLVYIRKHLLNLWSRDNATEEFYIKDVDFNYLEWTKHKDPNVFYDLVFPGWGENVKKTKYHICLDLCAYINKMMDVFKKKYEIDTDF